MKEKVLSILLLISIVGFSIANLIILNSQIKETTNELTALALSDGDAEEKANEIFESYMKKQKYMSITVSHDDLTNIEDCFVEMIACLSVGNGQDAEVTKSRLINALEHLRRLSGINIDAII